MAEIQWNVTEQNISQKLVSIDNRWHISKKQEGTKKTRFFMTDLLLTPSGAGKNYRECFETFIRNCDEFAKLLEQVRNEAEEHLKTLPETEGEPEKHEN